MITLKDKDKIFYLRKEDVLMVEDSQAMVIGQTTSVDPVPKVTVTFKRSVLEAKLHIFDMTAKDLNILFADGKFIDLNKQFSRI